MLANKVHLHTN